MSYNLRSKSLQRQLSLAAPAVAPQHTYNLRSNPKVFMELGGARQRRIRRRPVAAAADREQYIEKFLKEKRAAHRTAAAVCEKTESIVLNILCFIGIVIVRIILIIYIMAILFLIYY
jgi:hypothetical protein